MFKAILFDLDGTLLNIDMNYFIPHYLKAMQKAWDEQGGNNPEQFIARVLESTGVMIKDKSPEKLNMEVFMNHFFSSQEYNLDKTKRFFDDFYQEIFPQLYIYTEPFLEIPALMEEAFKKDIPVVIATNAVFPAPAIQARLEWAKVADFPYKLITSYENMHFCKPHVEYYQEIAQKINIPADTCLMVGNDVGEDLPASLAGMKTFLLEEKLIDNKEVPYVADWRGKINDLTAFIREL